MLRISLVALMVSAGCDLGEVPIPGGTPPPPGVDAGSNPQTPAAMTSYTTNVYPLLESKCSGCHTSGGNANFCAATATGSYSAIVALPAVVGTFVAASAPVLTKIAAGHQGVTYATVESNDITTWLNLEKAARP